FFFPAGLAYSECFLPFAMAYDCYAAISNRLHYAQTMSKEVCSSLVIYSYTGGFVNATILTSNTFTLDFCGDNIIDDFFCDRNKMVLTFYTVLFPMLNPMIYSLRNKDVKEALRKLFQLAPSNV
ncbi:hypothetical protein U0070_025564, partial [Myodes glareolus]